MKKSTKAVYTITTTYGLNRDMIFSIPRESHRGYIEAVNTRTGEYHQIPYKNDGYGDFLYTCECFIKEHFGKHLIYYKKKSYQKGDK